MKNNILFFSLKSNKLIEKNISKKYSKKYIDNKIKQYERKKEKEVKDFYKNGNYDI